MYSKPWQDLGAFQRLAFISVPFKEFEHFQRFFWRGSAFYILIRFLLFFLILSACVAPAFLLNFKFYSLAKLSFNFWIKLCLRFKFRKMKWIHTLYHRYNQSQNWSKIFEVNGASTAIWLSFVKTSCKSRKWLSIFDLYYTEVG